MKHSCFEANFSNVEGNIFYDEHHLLLIKASARKKIKMAYFRKIFFIIFLNNKIG
jgi:hypothetical protein